MRLVAAFSLALTLSGAGWSDRGEYDLVLSIRAEASPQKRLALLEQWKQKYPQSEMRQQRRELYLAAYQSVGDSARMLAVTREMLAEDPANYVGLYWSAVLIPEVKQPSPDLLNEGAAAAKRLSAGLNGFFDPARKPAAMSAEAWEAERKATGLLAQRALAWSDWQRGDLASAETEFAACLHASPKNAEISAWFGSELASQKDEGKQVAALWHLGRAASLKEEGALPEPQRRQIDALLAQLYASFHGSQDGLDDLRAKAAADAFPPPDFSIESAAVIAARKAEEELERTNPELAAWLKLRKRLDAPDGESYFAQAVHGSMLPRLKGTLIRCEPARKPNQLVLAISDAVSEEMVLHLNAPLPREAEAGTQIEFQAIADLFNKAPFRITASADPANIEGWPQDAPARGK